MSEKLANSFETQGLFRVKKCFIPDLQMVTFVKVVPN